MLISILFIPTEIENGYANGEQNNASGHNDQSRPSAASANGLLDLAKVSGGTSSMTDLVADMQINVTARIPAMITRGMVFLGLVPSPAGIEPAARLGNPRNVALDWNNSRCTNPFAAPAH